MERYLISFDRNLRDADAYAKILDRPKDAFVDGVAHLVQETKGLSSDLVLQFPSISVVSAVLSESQANALKLDRSVSSIRKSRKVSGTPLTAAPKNFEWSAETVENPAWHVSLVNADQCWTKSTGKGVKVGVVDSAIDPSIPDLPIVDGRSFHPEAPDWRGTEEIHGTFCAAIIGCRSTHPSLVGIAPECDLYALRIGKDDRGDVDYILAAMAWAVEQKLDILSMSQWDSDGADDPHEPYWESLNRAAEECAKAGCIVVGISGNSGSSDRPWVTNPGRCPEVIAVGGTRCDDNWWSGSSFGPDDLPENQAVEIVAPSTGIYSLGPGGTMFPWQGTSFAAPQVAGACALLKQLRPDLSPSQLRQILKSTSKDLGPAGRDAKFGVGRLDCLAAINALSNV